MTDMCDAIFIRECIGKVRLLKMLDAIFHEVGAVGSSGLVAQFQICTSNQLHLEIDAAARSA
jgi:hypothetical protein